MCLIVRSNFTKKAPPRPPPLVQTPMLGVIHEVYFKILISVLKLCRSFLKYIENLYILGLFDEFVDHSSLIKEWFMRNELCSKSSRCFRYIN